VLKALAAVRAGCAALYHKAAVRAVYLCVIKCRVHRGNCSVFDKIEKLEENPFPQEVERVEDFEGEKVFRVRVGDQRILYVVRYNPNKLIVVDVDKRSRVYD